MANEFNREQHLSKSTQVCLAVLCGLPGSGKSSLAKQVVDYIRCKPVVSRCSRNAVDDQSCNVAAESTGTIIHELPVNIDPSSCGSWKAAHICYDDLFPREREEQAVMQAKSHTEDPSVWKDYRKDILQCVDSTVNMVNALLSGASSSLDNLPSMCKNQDLINIYQECVWNRYLKGECCSQPFLLVIDDNMYYESMRYEYYQLARKYRTGYMQIFIPCSVELAKRRNLTRELPVPDEVVISMAARLEKPDHLTAWQKNTLYWTEESDICEVYDIATIAMHSPVEPAVETDMESKLASRVSCSRSTIHQTDQILRKLVKQQIATFQGSSKTELKQAAKDCNEVRIIILEQMRNQTLLIPEYLELCAENSSQDCGNEMYKYVASQFYKLL